MKDKVEDMHFKSPLDPGILWREVYYFEKHKEPKPGTFTLGVSKEIVVFGPSKYQATMNHRIEKVIADFVKRGWEVEKL